MKIKTADLTGPALDWAVGKALKLPPPYFNERGHCAQFSEDWAQAGPIITEAGISIIRCDDDWGVDEKGFCNDVRIPVWAGTIWQVSIQTSTEHQDHEPMYQIEVTDVMYGPTPLVAAMRRLVYHHFGFEIEVPDGI